MRYIPPNGTAGLARSAVRGMSRLPSPPASTIPSTLVATAATYPRVVRIDLLTREYPPEVYGGAGVHVEFLVRELRSLVDDVAVHCFGAPRDEPGVRAYDEHPPGVAADANAALRTMAVDLAMADACAGTDLVHSHTWY